MTGIELLMRYVGSWKKNEELPLHRTRGTTRLTLCRLLFQHRINPQILAPHVCMLEACISTGGLYIGGVHFIMGASRHKVRTPNDQTHAKVQGQKAAETRYTQASISLLMERQAGRSPSISRLYLTGKKEKENGHQPKAHTNTNQRKNKTKRK